MRLNERVDEDVELAALRRRAYGPHADIDAAGLERLGHLEALARRGRRKEETAPTPEPVPVPEPESAEASAPAPAACEPTVPASDPAAPSEPAGAPSLVARLRLGWPLLLAGAIGGAIAAGALGAAASQGDRPYATLTAPLEDPPGGEGPFPHGIAYGEVGAVTVGAAQFNGERCIWIRVPSDFVPQFYGNQGPLEFGECAPEPFTPHVRLLLSEGQGYSSFVLTPEAIPELGEGTYLQFELHDDEITVRRADRPEPTPETP